MVCCLHAWARTRCELWTVTIFATDQASQHNPRLAEEPGATAEPACRHRTGSAPAASSIALSAAMTGGCMGEERRSVEDDQDFAGEAIYFVALHVDAPRERIAL